MSSVTTPISQKEPSTRRSLMFWRYRRENSTDSQRSTLMNTRMTILLTFKIDQTLMLNLSNGAFAVFQWLALGTARTTRCAKVTEPQSSELTARPMCNNKKGSLWSHRRNTSRLINCAAIIRQLNRIGRPLRSRFCEALSVQFPRQKVVSTLASVELFNCESMVNWWLPNWRVLDC